MSIETLTNVIIREMPEINKWQRDFFLHLLGLFLSLQGRYTFLNLERYGGMNELTPANLDRKWPVTDGFLLPFVGTTCTGFAQNESIFVC